VDPVEQKLVPKEAYLMWAARLVDKIAREQALESVEEIIRAVFRATQQG